MLLSVIIPFYQVEKYIGACLDRAVLLPPEKAEILLVDDCGTDGSAKIAAEYAAKYPHVRVIRRAENGGLSAARNTGFDEAQGDYVYYLDSDDLPETEALLSLTEEASAKGLDVAKARFRYLEDRNGMLTDGPSPETAELTGPQLFEKQCRDGTFEPMVWQCIYRREFLLKVKLRMQEGILFEDEMFQAPALLQAERAEQSDRMILQYRQRAGSIMGSFSNSSEWCFSYMQVCRRLTTFAKKVPEGGPKKMLLRRIGQIALSTAKNITAYHLLPEPAARAREYVKSHKKELSRCAMNSGDLLIVLQGILLGISPDLFLRVYPG